MIDFSSSIVSVDTLKSNPIISSLLSITSHAEEGYDTDDDEKQLMSDIVDWEDHAADKKKEESVDDSNESTEDEKSETTTTTTTASDPASPSSKKKVQEYDICIVGAGLSGAVIAERYASQLNQTVVIVEKRDHIGGNCYDYIDKDTGIRVSQYGAHLFHTQYERVWKYVHKFSKWTKYEHSVVGIVNGSHVPIPVNIETVNTLFGLNISNTDQMNDWLETEQIKYDREPLNSEEMALSRVGPRLYELIFRPYTIKQWNKEPRELGPEVTARIPVRNNHDKRYFGDPFQALPSNGYTAIFENLLCHPNIETRLNTDYFKVRDTLKCKHTYFSGPIDAYYAHLGYKKLEYRSLDFERKVIKNIGRSKTFQPAFVVNHPSTDDNYTRIVEYKHLLNQTEISDHTVFFIERSSDIGEPYYPVPNEENKALYKKYQELAANEPGVTFVGRLANYKYFNMDEAILNALELFDKDNNIVRSANSKEKPSVATCFT